MRKVYLILISSILLFPFVANAADSNTISSIVVTDKIPPTASVPSVVINIR